MLDDARLKTLQRVTETKDAVTEALTSIDSPAGAEPLAELQRCLEEIEGDLDLTAIDQRIAELQAYQQRLLEIDGRLDKKGSMMKHISRKIEAVAKALGVVVEVAGKALPPL